MLTYLILYILSENKYRLDAVGRFAVLEIHLIEYLKKNIFYKFIRYKQSFFSIELVKKYFYKLQSFFQMCISIHYNGEPTLLVHCLH